jgi:hypothetical protein
LSKPEKKTQGQGGEQGRARTIQGVKTKIAHQNGRKWPGKVRPA